MVAAGLELVQRGRGRAHAVGPGVLGPRGGAAGLGLDVVCRGAGVGIGLGGLGVGPRRRPHGVVSPRSGGLVHGLFALAGPHVLGSLGPARAAPFQWRLLDRLVASELHVARVSAHEGVVRKAAGIENSGEGGSHGVEGRTLSNLARC